MLHLQGSAEMGSALSGAGAQCKNQRWLMAAAMAVMWQPGSRWVHPEVNPLVRHLQTSEADDQHSRVPWRKPERPLAHQQWPGDKACGGFWGPSMPWHRQQSARCKFMRSMMKQGNNLWQWGCLKDILEPAKALGEQQANQEPHQLAGAGALTLMPTVQVPLP